jgi:hypothetical protein
MDDDLMSLRGGTSSDSDDLFGSFDAPPSSQSMKPSGSSSSMGGLDLDLGGLPPPTPSKPAPSKAKPKKSNKKPSRKRSGGGGISPQQRMLLSIFLFLDVSVLGCLILFAVGAIRLP